MIISLQCIPLMNGRQLLSRVQRAGDSDCHIWLGAKTSNGYGMIRVKFGGELEPSKVIGVYRFMAMCQLRTVVPQLTFKRLICATIRCVSMKNIVVWNLTMSTSRGGLSSNTVEIILPAVLTAARGMIGTSLDHIRSENKFSGPVRLLPLVCCLFKYGTISFFH